MTKDEMKDELKNRISMALKAPILQQGFEIICKENAELKEEVKYNEDLATVAYMQGAESQKKKSEKKLTKAKELLTKWVELYKPKLEGYPIPPIQEQTEQFLKESE